MSVPRVLVVGAGPIGLEAALCALDRGLPTAVYEAGAIGDHVTRWGHVRLFSAFELNHSERGARTLTAAGHSLPRPNDYLTGAEHLERYLRPLARIEPLASCIHERTRVVSIGRDRIRKGDLIGGPRERHPFRVLVENDAGDERFVDADVVLDCSGSYGHHNWMGNGNVPALGERRLEEAVSYELDDIAGAARTRYEGKRVLLVGGGHSAATALDALQSLGETEVHWVARQSVPLEVIDDDPLPERKRLSELANRLAAGSSPRLRFHAQHTVDSVRRDGSTFHVGLSAGDGSHSIAVDRILALVGYRPDNTLYRELQIHECYASQGPMKLAAALLGESSADCLTQTAQGVDVLTNPEPNFFILGAKSYGRGSNFLIRIGIAQVEEIFASIENVQSTKGRRAEHVS